MSPRLPSESRQKREQVQNSGTWIALFFVLIAVISLVALTSQIMPQFAGLLLVVAGLFFFIAFHYFTWGRWLIARVEKLKAEEEKS